MTDLVLSAGNDYINKVFEENLKERKIILNTEVNDTLLEIATMNILRWNAEDKYIPIEERKPIKIYINSVGGEVMNGFNLMNIIMLSKTPVIGITMGYAYSCGLLILLACHKRYGFELSTYLLHDGVAGASSSAGKFKDIAKFYDETDERIKKFILSRTKIDEEFYDSKYGSEFYFFSDDALKFGVIDGIVGQDVPFEEII